MNYTYSAVYTPVYQIGEYAPNVHFTSATQSMQIQAENTNGLTPLTGYEIAPTVGIRNSVNLIQQITVKGLLNGESASVTAGDVARASLNVIQPLK